MLRSFHAERIVSRRTAIISAGIMAAFTALLTSLLFIGTDDVAPGSGPGAPGVSVDLNTAEGIIQGLASGSTMIGIVALAVFAISVAKDYERGTIRQLLVGEPRRAVLLGGKLLALVAVMIAGVALAAAVGIGAAFALSGAGGISTAAWTTSAGLSAVTSTTLNVALATVVWGLAGAALAMATRSASVAITGGIAYLLVGENLLSLVWETATQYLPGGSLNAFTSGGTTAVSYGQAAIQLTLYAIVFVVAAFLVFQRRDVTD